MTKEIITSIKEKKLIDDEIYLDYIEEQINKYNLHDFINGILLTTDDISGFDNKSGIMYFNPDMITWTLINKDVPDIDLLVSNKERKTNTIKEANLANLYNLFVLRHEIQHVIQDKVINTPTDSLLRNVLIKDTNSLMIDTNFFKNFYYQKYHDRFYNEYNANIIAYKEVLDNIEKLNEIELDPLIKKINIVVAKYLLYCYSDINNTKKYSTPIKNMYKLNEHLVKRSKEHDIEIVDEVQYSKFNKDEKPNKEIDKIVYGLNINPSTYDYIKKVSKGKIKTLNLFEQIKN